VTLRGPVAALLLAATASCVSEYHPEYHPETSTSFAHRVSYPTTVFAAAPPPALEVVCPPGTKTEGNTCVRTEVVTKVVTDVSCPAGFAWNSGHRACAARVDTTCSVGMRFQTGTGCVQVPHAPVHKTPGMVWIAAAAFWMGRTDGDKEVDDDPHRVTLKAFEMDEIDVTVAQYDHCVRAGGCTPVPTEPPACRMDPTENGDHPARCVTWVQASAFCAWSGKRLPTEAEWEYAARGVDARKYPWGDEEPSLPRGLVCAQPFSVWAHPGDPAYESACPAGAFPAGASPPGVLDMSGNVWQWLATTYAPGGDDKRVLRGGDYHAVTPLTARTGAAPLAWSESYGFRCAR
jgi:sulfatase modifying factor 1